MNHIMMLVAKQKRDAVFHAHYSSQDIFFEWHLMLLFQKRCLNIYYIHCYATVKAPCKLIPFKLKVIRITGYFRETYGKLL